MGDGLRRHAHVGAGLAHRRHAGAQRQLAGDEVGAPCRAAGLGVVVGEAHACAGEPSRFGVSPDMTPWRNAPMLNEPTSSPMMTRMLGFFAAVWASTGAAAKPADHDGGQGRHRRSKKPNVGSAFSCPLLLCKGAARGRRGSIFTGRSRLQDGAELHRSRPAARRPGRAWPGKPQAVCDVVSPRTAGESRAVIRITGGCGPRRFSASSNCRPDITGNLRLVMTQAAPPTASLSSSASAEA